MAASRPLAIPETAFVNAQRLTARQWGVTAGILCLMAVVTPWLWTKIERFQTGPDYRLPYALSQDYWLYQRRLGRMTPSNIAVLGDSVVWGEYVRANGTLSHFLNEAAGASDTFLNVGVNGLFPLALDGLIHYYGGALRGHKVLLHGNPLWMSSPKADLSTEKEEPFNHAALVPQFLPRIPCYRADWNERLDFVVQRSVPLIQWSHHLQQAYFGQQSILQWTLANDGGDPPRFPNVYRNPLAQITLTVPAEPAADPERGPDSPRHRAWSSGGAGTAHFDWVDLDHSLQWAAFCRLLDRLRRRGSDVLVVIGPFNEHMLAADNLPDYRRIREGMNTWLTEHTIAHLVPEALPSELYADASHPLTSGYRSLAQHLWADPVFQTWLNR